MLCHANNFPAKIFTSRLILAGWLMLAAQLPAAASQRAMLQWNPSANPNVVGYRIYYGTVSENYSNVVTVGNVTNAVITGLANSTTYFFAATTTDSAGNESDFSNEASFTTGAAVVSAANQPPTLNALTNLTVYQNAGSQTIALSGITAGSNQVLKVTASSSNNSLVAKPTVNYTSPQSTGTLTFKPSTTLTGTCTITVMVNDNAKSNNITSRTFTVTVLAPPNPLAPRLARQLTNSAALAGQTVSLSVAATGKAPLKYQWKLNGVSIPAATSPTLTIKGVKASQAGAYSVSVSNSLGATNSINALLSVYTSPAATLTAAAQTNGQFKFKVTGITGYKYVVQASSDLKNWAAVETNTAPFTFTDTNANSFNQRFYRTYYLP